MAGFDERMQIVATVFNGGQYQDYSIASSTRRLSDAPVIVTDEAGSMHLNWRQGAGELPLTLKSECVMAVWLSQFKRIANGSRPFLLIWSLLPISNHCYRTIINQQNNRDNGVLQYQPLPAAMCCG